MKTLIHTPTPSLDQSLTFYRRLGFEVVSASQPTLVRDAVHCIEINPDRFARAGVKIYRSSWGSRLPEIAKLTRLVELADGHVLGDGTGTWIYLVNGLPSFEIPGEGPASVLGKGAGLSLETTSYDQTLDLWLALGFEASSGSTDEGYASLTSEDGFVVTVMKPLSCPHLFFNPSMTYFNSGNNLSVIQGIRDAGVEITEEITHFNDEGIVDNVIVRDPGGYGFFVFND